MKILPTLIFPLRINELSVWEKNLYRINYNSARSENIFPIWINIIPYGQNKIKVVLKLSKQIVSLRLTVRIEQYTSELNISGSNPDESYLFLWEKNYPIRIKIEIAAIKEKIQITRFLNGCGFKSRQWHFLKIFVFENGSKWEILFPLRINIVSPG
jgi:hypothetical protein